VSSDRLIPREDIKFQRVIIEYLGGKETKQLLNMAEILLDQSYTCSITINLKHIQCREMVIEHNVFATLIFESSLRPTMEFSYSLILPNSLKVLHSYSSLVIVRIPRDLEELVCTGLLDIIGSWRMPESLRVFKAYRITDGTKKLLLSYYKSLKLRSLAIRLDTGLDFKYLKDLEELELYIYEPSERIPFFPPKLKKLHIVHDNEYYEYAEALPSLPKTLKEFMFSSIGNSYDMSLPKLPSGLEILKLEVQITKKINYFPESITELTLHGYSHRVIFSKLCKLRVLRIGYYKYDLKGLCDGLEELIFEDFSEYNRNIVLPPTVKKVWLSDSFNRKIDLPDSLEEIIFGYEFNQKVVLPPRAIKVTFGNRFNQEIDLPDSLKEIVFGECFNKPIKKLPPNLRRLVVGKHLKDSLPPLPRTLKEINFL
jgi:hypothetical protein